jgi:GGDEF domain-containing protein
MSASHGFCAYPDDVTQIDPNAMLEKADADMYVAKSKKKRGAH